MDEVYIAACTDYNEQLLNDAVEKQCEALALQELIKPGASVVVKPNLVIRRRPQEATTTHPMVVAAVCRTLKRMGAGKITVADSPGGPYNPTALRSIYSGCEYDTIAKNGCAELNFDCTSRPLEVPNVQRCRLFEIISPLLDADVIVDIAKLKTHAMTGLSGAVKNMFGAVPGLLKPEMHCRFPQKADFSAMLVDLCEAVRPSVCFVDAIVGMEGNGPSGGTPRFVGALIASKSPYAADVVCSELIGIRPEEVLMLRNAMDRGLCPKSIAEIKLLGEPVSRFVVRDFKQPDSRSVDVLGYIPRFARPLAAKLLTPRPAIRTSSCVGCGKCAESCPQHTIEIKNKKAAIDYSKCIRCYCCHEMCPVRAIDIKRFKLLKI